MLFCTWPPNPTCVPLKLPLRSSCPDWQGEIGSLGHKSTVSAGLLASSIKPSFFVTNICLSTLDTWPMSSQTWVWRQKELGWLFKALFSNSTGRQKHLENLWNRVRSRHSRLQFSGCGRRLRLQDYTLHQSALLTHPQMLLEMLSREPHF